MGKRKNDLAYFGLKGLNCSFAGDRSDGRTKAGLRVSTWHIETAVDFHNAVAAGVDEIKHMVGYSPDQKALRSEGLRVTKSLRRTHVWPRRKVSSSSLHLARPLMR
jgi:hypothetical protein